MTNSILIAKKNYKENGCDFSGSTFEDANLSFVIFGQSNLGNSSFRSTNLRNTNLENTIELTASALRGADLFGSRLPIHLNFSSTVERIEKLSRNLNRTLLFLIVFTLYSCLIASSSNSSSPINLYPINSDIDFFNFLIFSSLIILTTYIHMHIILQKIWDSISSLPIIFPDGATIFEKIYPTLLSEFAIRHIRVMKDFAGLRPPTHYWIQYISAFFFGWLFFPLSILFILFSR